MLIYCVVWVVAVMSKVLWRQWEWLLLLWLLLLILARYARCDQGNMLACLRGTGGSIAHGWLAGWHVHGPLSCTRKRVFVCLFNSAFDSSSSTHQQNSTTTPHQAVLDHRHVWCPTLLVSTHLLTPALSPCTLRDDILEFCNANGSSLPLSGGRYETRCGLT